MSLLTMDGGAPVLIGYVGVSTEPHPTRPPRLRQITR